MSAGKVLVTGADLAAPALELLRDFEMVYAGKAPTEDDLVALCQQHNPVAIIVRYGKVTERMMQAAPALQVISKHGSGTDTIDKVAAQARNIEVVAAIGVNAGAVAEQTMALLLACAKSVVTLNARVHAGYWDKATHKTLELSGRTVGLIGLGAIGLRFARMADAMGMRVIGFDPFAKALPDYITPVSLETLWAQSDVVSLHCPLTDNNRNLINEDTLSQCKSGVIVINTARGGLINEADLLQAVRNRHVAAAGLDSFAVEPILPDHPFLGEPHFVLSPHIGGVTSDAYINMGIASAQNFLQVLNARKVTEVS